jgi:UDP-N-acetylglucosamine 2-epimerase (non-hydrolysing)
MNAVPTNSAGYSMPLRESELTPAAKTAAVAKMPPVAKARVMIVVGARPNFMKAAPILAAIRLHNDLLEGTHRDGNPKQGPRLDSLLVHTGQHYDEAMSDRFFADLNIPKPDVHLGAGSGSHAGQTAEIMKRFEEVLLRERPDLLVVVGDVNSTLACSLVASKISYGAGAGRARPLIAHVESGLRSFDRDMPEEVNRVLTDHMADLLFVTEDSGLRNLRREGVPDARVHFVGNTMIDSLLAFRQQAEHSSILDMLSLRNSYALGQQSDQVKRYALLTLHRPSNVDLRDDFLRILDGLRELASTYPVIFPAHPRTQKKIADFGLEAFFTRKHSDAGGRIRLVDPLGYIDFLSLMLHAALVVTDSGGIQEETTSLGVPCVTVRENTERPVTVEVGTNILAGTSPEGIRRAARRQMGASMERRVPEAWDGRSAQRILDVICRELMKRQSQSASA